MSVKELDRRFQCIERILQGMGYSISPAELRDALIKRFIGRDEPSVRLLSDLLK
jgi:hypothetical protein